MFSLFKQNRSLTLLVSLLFLILFLPFFETSRITSVLFVILLTGALLSGVYAISYDARYFAIGFLLAAPILICRWSNIVLNSPTLDMLGRISAVVFMTYTLIALLEHVLTSPRIGLNEVFGAICVYVLIGSVFGLVYALIEAFWPGSFHFSHDPPAPHVASFVYFSFVALSTVGFGDIVAVSPFARSLVVVEIIIGVIYVAVLIGRLVSASHMRTKGAEAEDAAERRRKEMMLRELLRKPVPLAERPIGLVMASVMINFAASVLMIHFHLPFFLDSCGTSLAVMLGGLWPGVATAVLYNLLIAATYWGWSSWVWMFCSILVAVVTWFFSTRSEIGIHKPIGLAAVGLLTGLLNSLLAQFIVTVARLPTFEGTFAAYSFFLKLTSNESFAALAEKFFVEIADKTISLTLAAVMVFLLRDTLTGYKKSLTTPHS